MSHLPNPLIRLIEELQRLPGIGPKGAQRLAFHILKTPRELAREAGQRGGCLTAVYNAANEEAAAAFLDGRIRFPTIVRTIADVLHAADQWAAEPATVEEVLDAQRWARDRARGAVSREVVSTK